MNIVDKIYVHDDAENEKTLAVLDFLIQYVNDYNFLTGRKILVFRITEAMKEQGDVLRALKAKGIGSLPALEITNPTHIIHEGVNNITGFIMMLMQKGKQKQQQARVYEDDIGMQTESVPGLNSFYRDEILGKGQEESQEQNLSNNLADSHRRIQERRAAKMPSSGGNAMEADNVDHSGPGQPRPPVGHVLDDEATDLSIQSSIKALGAEADDLDNAFLDKFSAPE